MSTQSPVPDPALPTARPHPSAPAEPDRNPPRRLIPALALGVVLTIMPTTGALVALVPARLTVIDPAHKVSTLAVIALAGAIVALLANIIFGALSDLTRSRFGRRAPWLALGAVGSAATLLAVGHATSGGAVVAWWCAYQACYGAVMAPMTAVIPDRIPVRRRGIYSSVFGAGTIVGGAGGIAIGGHLVLHTQTGFIVLAAMALASGLVFVVIAAEPSNAGDPRPRFSPAMVAHHFSFPRRGARDLYFALGGKLLQVIAAYGVTNFQLYLLTDYMHVGLGRAGAISSVVSLLGVPLSIGLGIVAGILSDRIHRRKVFVIGAAFLGAVAQVFPFFVPHVWAFVTYALVLTAALGIYTSVDQALNTEVLPSRETAAKDLGVVNISSTAGMVLGPALAGVVVNAAGGYRPLFVMAFAALLVSALLIKPIRRSR